MSFATKKPFTMEDLEETQTALITAISGVLDIQKMQGEMLSKVLVAVTRVPAGENKLETVLRDLCNGQITVEERLAELAAALKSRG